MVVIVKIISLALVIFGCLVVLRPGTLKQIIEKAKEGNKMYIAGALKAVIGIIFVIAAPNCAVAWVIRFFGALALFGGLMCFILKRSFIVSIMDWVERQPARFTYYYGIFVVLLGVVIALAI